MKKFKRFLIECLPVHLYRIYDGLATWKNRSGYIKNWLPLALAEKIRAIACFANVGPQFHLKLSYPLVKVDYSNGIQLLVTSNSLGVVSTTQENLAAISNSLENKICIDIGAHIGSVAAELGRRGAKVFAYEPDPENFIVLQRNFSLNGLESCQAFQEAIAERSGPISFSLGASPTTGSLSHERTLAVQDSKKSITIMARTLPEVFSIHSIEQCELLKMDCEGGEYGVLLSLDSQFFSKIQNILMEIHPHKLYQKNILISHLMSTGFDYRELSASSNGCVDGFFFRS